MLAVVLVALAGSVAAPASAAPYRAFSLTSPWNIPAAAKGPIDTGNPYSGQFTSYSSKLAISGIPPSVAYAKPIYFAAAGDPARTGKDINGWPKGDIRYDGGPIPVPAGMKAAPGSDGHLTIVSADRQKAWDMWRCKQLNGSPCDESNVLASGYRAEVIVQWDLTGSGVPAVSNDNTSARGSGTPVLPTTIRADEALGGIDHAIGVTVPRVSSDYVYPVATHSDGSLGASGIKYGMLFVLRADYAVPANASIGVRNVIQALKTYGAYVVDQGASFELDADSTRPDLWAQAGLSETSLSITPNDMRYVNLGGTPAPAPAPAPAPDPAPAPVPAPTPIPAPAPGTGTGSTAGTGTSTGGKRCTKRLQRRGKCTVGSARVTSEKRALQRKRAARARLARARLARARLAHARARARR
jgi:hypothetical protein